MNLLEAQRAVFASDLGPNEKLVAFALLNHWCRARDTFPGVERLVKWTSLSRRSVLRAVQALEDAGAIAVARKSGLANRYDLTPLAAFTSATQAPVPDSHQCPTGTPPVPEGHGTSATQAPDQCHTGTRSDPGSDPGSDPRKGEAKPPPARPEVYRTDGAGTRLVDPCAASFAPRESEKYAFAAWCKAFGKSGASYDSKRAACLSERVGAGMTKQDTDDAIAGALADDYVTGKKDGKKHDGLLFIFGDAERFEEYRDAGRAQRQRTASKVSAPHDNVRKAEMELTFQERRRADIAAAAAKLAKGSSGSTPSPIKTRDLTKGLFRG